MSLTESLQSFHDYLVMSYSKPTQTSYYRHIRFFVEFLAPKKVTRASQLRPKHINEYLTFKKTEGSKPASLMQYYSCLKSFCGYLRKMKLMSVDVMESVSMPKKVQKVPNVPTPQQVTKLLEIIPVHKERGVRDRAMLELLYSSGLRVSELCDLCVEDVEEKQVKIKCGKGGRPRTVPLTSSALLWINRYIDVTGRYQGPLFVATWNKPITRQRVNSLVTSYAKQAKIPKLSPHSLRHACATHLLESGADIRMIQELLGHACIASTQIYTSLTSEKIQTMFQEFHPRK